MFFIDGIMFVFSCGGGVDSWVWIFKGVDCENLGIVGVNDDCCDIGDGDDYVFYREVVVIVGDIYYIMFDNVWLDFGFGFEFVLVEEVFVEG